MSPPTRDPYVLIYLALDIPALPQWRSSHLGSRVTTKSDTWLEQKPSTEDVKELRI